jgi:hypothetical protein
VEQGVGSPNNYRRAIGAPRPQRSRCHASMLLQ